MVKEYLKLARSFNAALTGVAPVLGAIAMQEESLLYLFLLFLVGFLGHTYGFVLNDIIDYKIDRNAEEIKDRPLISGKISIRAAWIFAFVSLAAAFIIATGIALDTNTFFPLIVLAFSAGCITIYDLISKKFPGTDVFVAGGIFLLILYGATTVSINITQLTWLVCILGTIQVLFMQFVAGGLKDIENDYKSGANTFAVKLGVRIENKRLKVPTSFWMVAYGIQGVNILLVFLPLFIIFSFSWIRILHIIALAALSILMLIISYKLLSMKRFKRDTARKLIGSHYSINYALVPIMLMALNPWVGLIVLLPPLGFILSNVVLHGTVLQPKTM